MRAVFSNGAAARKLWDRHVASRVEPPAGADFVTLPSASPANARLTLEMKTAAWLQAVEAAAGADD